MSEGMNIVTIENSDQAVQDKLNAEVRYYNRPHYVVWSGGVDSTSILMDMIGKLKERNKYRVHTIYVDHQQLYKKAEKEREVRSRLLHLIDLLQLNSNNVDDRKDYIVVEDHVVEVRLNNLAHSQHEKSCSQPYFWLSSILPYVEPNAVVHFGYLKDESAFEFIDTIKEFVDVTNRLLGREVSVEFPYMNKDKAEVLSNFIEMYPSLYDQIWFCEGVTRSDDISKPCYTCSSCRTHMKALHEVFLNNQNRLRLTNVMYDSASSYENIEEYIYHVQADLLKWVHDNVGFKLNNAELIMLGRIIFTYLCEHYDNVTIVSALCKEPEDTERGKPIGERDDHYTRVRVYININDKKRIDITHMINVCEYKVITCGRPLHDQYKFVKDLFITDIMQPNNDIYVYKSANDCTPISVKPNRVETLFSYLDRVKELDACKYVFTKLSTKET